MKKNIISVIIPVYNAEKTIEKCVESLVYGKFRDIDIILVDDCSKDNSWTMCKELSEKYENVHSYQNEKNSGVSYTRNHGLQEAKGEYILFVDSDDWVSGRYVSTLLEYAKQYPSSLVVCGLHFHDDISSSKRDYVWQQDGEEVYLLGPELFFELTRRFHLQQLWNKIFRRDIIEQFGICFDETQSMGEDFQFVLDYMEAAQYKQCVVLNTALYYYIRANNSSLMSRFGLIENGNEYKRLEKLLKISGADIPEVKQNYLKAIQETKVSYVYFVVRANSKSKNEKIDFIENIMLDGQAKRYYRTQRVVMIKENMVNTYVLMQKAMRRIKGKLQRCKNERCIKRVRAQFRDRRVSIISQNCIGGVIYHDMGKQFLSPTIDLYFSCMDFVKFVLNLEHYMSLKLRMEWEEEYPVGFLDDVKIYFMHYKTCTEAKEAWNRRKKRINYNNILVLSTDMEGFSQETFELWKKIEYPKVLFSANKWEDDSCVYFPQYQNLGKVADLIPERKFYMGLDFGEGE